MKRLASITLIFILLVSTIGINATVHFCGGEYLGVVINGIQFTTDIGEEMTCCMNENSQCDGCKHVKHFHRIQSQYMQGQQVNIHPLLSFNDWFHGDLPTLILSFIDVEEGGTETDFNYLSPYHPIKLFDHHGLRAPPTLA